MAGLIIFAALAAFGAVSILWALFGWLLPGRGGVVVCQGSPGLPESFFIRKYAFLRQTGLLTCPLVVIDRGMSDAERRWVLSRGGQIGVYPPEQFRGEWEKFGFDGTGIGDPSGRDQRCGISEL